LKQDLSTASSWPICLPQITVTLHKLFRKVKTLSEPHEITRKEFKNSLLHERLSSVDDTPEASDGQVNDWRNW
jgi:hypothetical protein